MIFKILIIGTICLSLIGIGLFYSTTTEDIDVWRAGDNCEINGEDCCDTDLKFNFEGYQGIYPGIKNYRICKQGLHQGPVPKGEDQEHFWKTGERRQLNG